MGLYDDILLENTNTQPQNNSSTKQSTGGLYDDILSGQQNDIVQDNKEEQQSLADNLKKSTKSVAKGTAGWWKKNIRPAHFLADVGKATANGFRDESIMGANAITGAKNWALDKVGLSDWHKPTEDVKREREEMIPKFELNPDAKVSNFIGDMIGWAPSFAVGGEGVAAAKGGVAATKTGIQALLRGKRFSRMAKILDRQSRIAKATSKPNPIAKGVNDVLNQANNAGLDMAAFEGLRNRLRYLGGDELESSLGEDLGKGYLMGGALGGAMGIGSKALSPIVKAGLNTGAGKKLTSFFKDRYNKYKKLEGLNDIVSNTNDLPSSVETYMDKAGKFSSEEEDAMFRKLKYGDENPTPQELIEGNEPVDKILKYVKERAANKDYTPPEPTYMTSENFMEQVEYLRREGFDDTQIADFMDAMGVKLQEPDIPVNEIEPFEVPLEPIEIANKGEFTPIAQENVLEEAAEIPYLADLQPNQIEDMLKQPEPVRRDLSMPKQDLGINTPKEDLTHVNEPSMSSNNIEANIEQPKTKQVNNQNITNKSITKKPYKSQREKNMERANYKYLVTEDGSPINTKFGSRAKIKDNGTYKIDNEGNVVADRFGNPIKEKNIVPTAISGWENYPISKQPNWVEPKANRSSNITEGLGNKDADMLDVKLKSGKAEGSDTLNKFTNDKHENIYKNVKKEEVHTETTPSSYSKETIQNLKKNYELMPDGKTVVKKGKNKNTKLTKSELNRLKNDLQKEYDANEKYRFEEEYSDNAYDKYTDKDIWEEGSEPNTIPEYVKPEDKDFNDFYNKFKLASEEEQEALLRSEFERRGGTKEAFNGLYKDVLDQTERDRILNDKPQLGKEAYKDTVSEDFFKQADKLGRTIEDTPHVVKRKEIGEVSYKDRKKADVAWSYTLKNNKTNPKIILTGTLNKYRGDITKAQATYDKLFNKVKDSSYTGRTRDIMFDDLENAADKYENLHKNKIQRHKDISGEKVKANKVLDELKSADDLIGEKLMKDNKWVLKKTGNYNGNDVVSEHYAKRSVKRIAQIEDLANAQKAIERAKEKANKMSSKWKDKRLKYIEENPQEIIENDLDKARKLWQRSKGFIKNTYTDYSLKEASTSYHGEYKKLGDTRSTELDDITKRDAAWKRVEAKVEGLLYGDMPNKIGKALEQGEGLKHYIGKTTTIGNLMQKFPKEFNAKLRKVFQNIKNKKVRVNESEYFKGSNTKDAITLSEGATFKTLKHEMGHENFSKSSLENSFVKEHYDENTEITHLYEDFINDNITTLDNIKGKFNGNFPSIEKALSSNKLSTEEKEVVKGLRNHYRLLKSSCEEQYCDMIADGSYTGSVERFVKTYNEVYPQWLEKVKATGVEGEEANARRLTKIIQERLQKPGRPASKISRPDESFRDILREGRQIAETDVKREVEREVVKYNVDFDSNGVPDKPEVVKEVLDKKATPVEMSDNYKDVYKNIESMSKQGENIATDLHWITPEQAANRIKMQGGKHGALYFKQGSKGLTAGLDITKDPLESRSYKEGLSGKKILEGLSQKGTTKDIVFNTAKETYKRQHIADCMDYIEKNYAKPLWNKVPDGETKINKYAFSYAQYMGYGSEFLDVIMKGDKAIDANFGRIGDGSFAKGLKELRKHWVKDGEYHYTIPKSVKNFVLDEHGETFAEYRERYIKGNPEENGGIKGSNLKANLKLLGALNDFALERFKRGVLTSSSFFLNNRIGNQMMIAANADNAVDYLRSFIKAGKLKDNQIPIQLRESIVNDAVNGSTLYKIDTGIPWLDNFMNLCRGNFINLKSTKRKTIELAPKSNHWVRLEGQTVPKGSVVHEHYTGKTASAFTLDALLAAPNWLFNKMSDALANVNQACEVFERKQAAYIKSKKVLKEHADLIPKTARQAASLPHMMQLIKDNPELELSLVKSVEDMLGNYRSFNKYEKNLFKRIIPFYSWYRTMFRHETRLFKQNPTRWGLIHYELQQLKNDNKKRKDYQQDAFNTGLKDNGTNIVIGKGAQVPYNTYTEVIDNLTGEGSPVGNLNPYGTQFVEALRGRKFFLDEEIQDRKYVRSSKGNNEVYDTDKKDYIGKYLPLSARLNYIGKNSLLPMIYPALKSPIAAPEYWVSGIKSMTKGKGWKTPDKYFDSNFGGYNAGDKYEVAPDKTRKRYAANDLSEGYKLSNRLLGTTFQKERPLSKKDIKERKQKEAEWRKKHKDKKRK